VTDSDPEPTDELLAPLTRGPAAIGGWREPATLRRSVRRRRYGLGASVVSIAVVIALAVVLVPKIEHHARPVPLAAGLSVGDRIGASVQLVAEVGPLPAPDEAAARAVATTEQAFTVALLKQLNRSDGKNLSVSPMSLAIALSMLQNGARGGTLDEISATLRSSGISTQQQDAGWSALVRELTKDAANNKISLQSANSLWAQQGLPLDAQFMSSLAEYFASGVWQVDFEHNLSGAVDALNAWTKEHTNGRITKLFDKGQLDETTLLVLANAVYFNAAWAHPFDPNLTTDRRFTLDGASDVMTKFMEQTSADLAVAKTSTYEAVQLPYTGGRFAALAIMPTAQSLTDFTAALTPTSLSDIARSLTPSAGGVTVSLPKFTTTSDTDLNTPLQQLGMPTAFTDQANFSGLSSVPLEVQSAIQRVFLSVGEKGTEAAAVTGLSMRNTSAQLSVGDITLDHPFLFLIRDTETGAVLFASQIRNPVS
jgi:serpin B